MDRSKLREKLISDMRANPPSSSSHFTQWCKKYNYIDLIKDHTSYLPHNCKFTERIYHILYSLFERPKCKYCRSKFVKFHSLAVGYRDYCSNGCVSPATRDKAKQTTLKRFGTEHALQSTEVQKRMKQTNLEKYNVENPFQAEEVKKKIRQTNLEKYNVENPSQSEKIKEKRRQTCLERYNVENPFQAEEIKGRIKQACIERFGVEYSVQSEEVQEKAKQTNLKRYGVKYTTQFKSIKEKSRQSMLDRYGVENPSQIEEVKQQKKQHFFQTLTSSRLRDHYEPLFSLEEFKGVKSKNIDGSTQVIYYPFRCEKCNTEFKYSIANGRVPRCPTCYPKNESTGESEVTEFCRMYFNKVYKDRETTQQELDIYIPDINLAIEYDGLYWHSELSGGKDRYFHFQKSYQCWQQGINLIHIFEDEWINKRSIVESILLNKFGKIQDRIYARKCKLTKVNNKIAKDFYFNNHIAGSISGTTIGLAYNNQLVLALTVGKPRFGGNHSLEIYRFCGKLNTIVVGGFSKLLSNIVRYMKPKSIITFADARYGIGNVYRKAGFTRACITEPNYYYFRSKDRCQRFSRVAFQKHKLKDKLEMFDPNLTEWENMQLNGYDRIWDCGHVKYELNV